MEASNFPLGLWTVNASDLDNDELLSRGVLAFDGVTPFELDVRPGYLIDLPSKTLENGMVVQYADEGLHAEQVFARALDGSYFILRDVSGSLPELSKGGYTGQHLRGQTLLVTQQPIDPNPLVKELHVKVPGLREWTGQQCFEAQLTASPNARPVVSFSSDENHLLPVTLFEDEAVRVTVVFEPAVSGLIGYSYRFSYEVDCSLWLEFLGKPLQLDEALSEWMHRTVDFLSYCMGFKRSITEVEFVTKEGIEGTYHAPLTGVRGPASYHETHHMPLQLPRIKSRTQEMLGAWYGFEGYARNAATLVVSLMSDWKMPVDMAFLMSAQALEALSRVGVDELEMPEEKFNERLAMIEKIDGENMNSRLKRWILLKLRGANWKPAGQLRDDLMKKLDPLTSWVIPNASRFKVDHRECRNAYTHRRDINPDNQLSPRELWEHTGAVRLLCYGAVAMLLGLKPGEMVAVLNETKYGESELLAARRLYAKV